MHSSQVVTTSHSPRPRASSHHFVLCLFLCLLAVISSRAIGQSTGGRVLGRVLDPSGAVVPDVALTLTNDDSGKALAVQSSKTGDYIFPAVPVGTYRLEAQTQGFQNFTATGILVNLNATVTYDVKLTVGANTQAVEVTAEAPLVDTTTTQLGAVINERAVQNLPLNSRDTYQLLQLQPGVQGVGGSDLFYGSDKPGAVSVNGGRGRSNNFSVNGGDGNDLFVNSPGIEPSPDAIQEFKVITNTFDAEYGRNSGAIINVVTKSGTNQFHGSIYDYVRNSIFDAKGYFNLTTPDDTQNQFGATIGGPIRHDKTFFFVSYEGRQLVRRHPWRQDARANRSGEKRAVLRICRHVERLDGRKHTPEPGGMCRRDRRGGRRCSYTRHTVGEHLPHFDSDPLFRPSCREPGPELRSIAERQRPVLSGISESAQSRKPGHSARRPYL